MRMWLRNRSTAKRQIVKQICDMLSICTITWPPSRRYLLAARMALKRWQLDRCDCERAREHRQAQWQHYHRSVSVDVLAGHGNNNKRALVFDAQSNVIAPHQSLAADWRIYDDCFGG